MNAANKFTTVKTRSNAWDGSFQLMSWWKPETVRKAKVMVVGAGALGNEVIKNLALLGIGHLLVVDYDVIEYTNLSRSILFRADDCGRKKGAVAVEQIKGINPNVKVQYIEGDITVDVGLGVFRRMDVIVGCLDNRLTRLSINRSCHKVDKTWIDGAIQDLGGQIQVFKPGVTCYECTLTARDRAFLEHRLSCLDVAQQHTSAGSIPTTPISASIIAAIQSQEALKAIDPEMAKTQMLEEYIYYEGRGNLILQLKYPKLRDNCPSHFTYDPIMEAPLSSSDTVADALAWLREHTKDNDPYIALDNVLVTEVTSKQSEKTTQLPTPLPKSKIKGEIIKQYTELPSEELMLTGIVTELNQQFHYQDMTLRECGIPPLHIIRVLTDDGEIYVELTKDEDFIHFQ